MQNSW